MRGARLATVLRITSSLKIFSTSAARKSKAQADAEKVCVKFVTKARVEKAVKVPVGMSMLEAAHENGVELEGACEGSLACSTCHVIITDEELYKKLPEPSDEENDMLDLAFGLTEMSRLGYQVIATPGCAPPPPRCHSQLRSRRVCPQTSLE